MDIFECSICLELLKDPRVIPCGHSFCKSCLLQLKPNQLRCPLCQTAFNSVESLPPNYIVLKWMDESNPKPKRTKQELNCQNCEQQIAALWCEQCSGIHYCHSCDSILHSNKAIRHHIRISVAEKSKRPNFTKCKSHMEEEKFFCGDCKIVLCSVCVVDDHAKHNNMSIYKYADVIRNELKAEMVSRDEVTQHYDNLEKDTVSDIKEKEKKIMKLENELNQKYAELNEQKKKIENIINQKEQFTMSHVVLIKSIEEMGIIELLNSDNIKLMKERIQNISNDLPILPKDKEQQIPFKWEFCENGLITFPSFRASGQGAWVGSSLLSGNTEIIIRIDVTTTNGWFQIGIANLTKFDKPGYLSPGNMSFCYHGWNGTVNNAGTFPHFKEVKTKVMIKFTIRQNKLSFCIGGEKQPGEWKIPSQYRVLVDAFHPSTIVELVDIKPLR